MKAIVVKYFGPTNTRGSRFKASAAGAVLGTQVGRRLG
jgi:hypothetical protein